MHHHSMQVVSSIHIKCWLNSGELFASMYIIFTFAYMHIIKNASETAGPNPCKKTRFNCTFLTSLATGRRFLSTTLAADTGERVLPLCGITSLGCWWWRERDEWMMREKYYNPLIIFSL
jgi:hypothetical protein